MHSCFLCSGRVSIIFQFLSAMLDLCTYCTPSRWDPPSPDFLRIQVIVLLKRSPDRKKTFVDRSTAFIFREIDVKTFCQVLCDNKKSNWKSLFHVCFSFISIYLTRRFFSWIKKRKTHKNKTYSNKYVLILWVFIDGSLFIIVFYLDYRTISNGKSVNNYKEDFLFSSYACPFRPGRQIPHCLL